MTVSKSTLPTECSPQNVTSVFNAGVKTVTAVYAYKHGVVKVIEFTFNDASTQFIKCTSNGNIEIGGTLEMGTGTKVSW